MLEIASAAATVEGKAANVVQPPQTCGVTGAMNSTISPIAQQYITGGCLSRQHFLLAEVMKPRPIQTYQSVAMDSLSLRNVLVEFDPTS